MVKIIFTGVQVSPSASENQDKPARSSSGPPAFRFSNSASMNLDGPGYALTLLLLGKYFERNLKDDLISFKSK